MDQKRLQKVRRLFENVQIILFRAKIFHFKSRKSAKLGTCKNSNFVGTLIWFVGFSDSLARLLTALHAQWVRVRNHVSATLLESTRINIWNLKALVWT